jgi:hypothetical protein
MRYNKYDVSVLQLTTPHEILLLRGVLKDISWVWIACHTGLLLFLVLYCNNLGYITGEKNYRLIGKIPCRAGGHFLEQENFERVSWLRDAPQKSKSTMQWCCQQWCLKILLILLLFFNQILPILNLVLILSNTTLYSSWNNHMFLRLAGSYWCSFEVIYDAVNSLHLRLQNYVDCLQLLFLVLHHCFIWWWSLLELILSNKLLCVVLNLDWAKTQHIYKLFNIHRSYVFFPVLPKNLFSPALFSLCTNKKYSTKGMQQWSEIKGWCVTHFLTIIILYILSSTNPKLFFSCKEVKLRDDVSCTCL